MGKRVGMILTYNCEDLLERAVRNVPSGVFDELFVTDDGSLDATRDVAARLGLSVVEHPHAGYGGNVKWGLRHALGRGADLVVEIHGDGQYDFSNIASDLHMVEEQGLDLTLGSRFLKAGQARADGMPLMRRVANRVLSSIVGAVFGLPLTEFHSGFRIYSRKLIQTLPTTYTSEGHLFSFQVIAQARLWGLKIGEIPARCDYRGPHTSISLFRAAIYFFQTFLVLALYVCARAGVRMHIFKAARGVDNALSR